MDDREEEVITTVKPRAAKQDRTTIALLFVAALVAVGGMGFAVGHLTAPAAAAQPTFSRNRPGGLTGEFPGGNFPGGNFPSLAPGQTFDLGQFGGGNARNLGGDVVGTVQSVDGTTMTIKLASGQTVTVNLSGTTTYHNETSGSADQVKVGSNVLVQIDTAAAANGSPNPGASGQPGGRQVSAKDVLITNP